MEFWGSIIELFHTKMEKPDMFGLFHISSILITIALLVILYCYRKSPDEKFVRKLLLVSSVIVIILEIYKQITYTFSYDGVRISADYQWYIFPFQFCSTPMYIGLLAGLIKNKRIHESMCAYLSTYAVFAGLSVIIYPAQVLYYTLGVNIQSMVCHGSMVIIGVYLLASGYVKLEHRTILKAFPVFLITVVIAIILNETAYFSGLLENETFNMFFISPHTQSTLPIYSELQKMVPYLVCLAVYIIGFTVIAYLILLVAMSVKSLLKKRCK